jgi:ATP-dependent Lhr-like helicase
MLPKFAPPDDALDALELDKDRVRLLLERYGVLFRELLQNELPPLRWGALFRALRLMELGGEIVAGQFFEGIGGLQFISHEGLRGLQADIDRVYWFNAADPVSVCGLGIEGLLYELPARKKSSHLVFHGTRLILVSERSGKALTIHVPANNEHLSDYFGPLRNMVERSVSPKRSIELETINGFRMPPVDPVVTLWKLR